MFNLSLLPLYNGWILSGIIMEVNIKEQLIKSVDSIKNKIKTIQNAEDVDNLKFKKLFKPITDPLETLIKVNDKNRTILGTRKGDDNTMRRCSSSIDFENFKEFIEKYSNDDSESYNCTGNDSENDTFMSLNKEDMIEIYDNNMNVPFGIRSENKNLMMGNSKVSFSFTNNVNDSLKSIIATVNDKHYEITPGLKELLLRNRPDLSLVTETDKMVYKDMLSNTNAHKRDFNPNGQLKGDKGLKYRQIIKPLFSEKNYVQHAEQVIQSKSGGYLPKLKKKYKSNTDYVYWDDPNELIDRLRLLIASKNAGNTNHDNEIISIVEELKEAGVIKE